MNVFLAAEIAYDTTGACFPGESLNQPGPPSNERDASATGGQSTD
jgi:hypothetical protein